MENLTKNQQITLIKKISSNLAYILDNIKMESIYSNYLKENINEEKRHLNFKPDNCNHGLTAIEGGIFFAVKQIVEFFQHKNYGLKDVYIPKAEDYLHIRKTVFTAYAIVTNYNDQIKDVLKIDECMEVLKMDYVCLVQTDKKGNTFPEYHHN